MAPKFLCYDIEKIDIFPHIYLYFNQHPSAAMSTRSITMVACGPVLNIGSHISHVRIAISGSLFVLVVKMSSGRMTRRDPGKVFVKNLVDGVVTGIFRDIPLRHGHGEFRGEQKVSRRGHPTVQYSREFVKYGVHDAKIDPRTVRGPQAHDFQIILLIAVVLLLPGVPTGRFSKCGRSTNALELLESGRL